jgi:hypothetical protein
MIEIVSMQFICIEIFSLRWSHSSAGEHYVDIVGVTGSIPVATTIIYRLFADLIIAALVWLARIVYLLARFISLLL